MRLVCKNCGKEFAEGCKTCPWCNVGLEKALGREFAPDAIIYKTPLTLTVKVCEQCGAKMLPWEVRLRKREDNTITWLLQIGMRCTSCNYKRVDCGNMVSDLLGVIIKGGTISLYESGAISDIVINEYLLVDKTPPQWAVDAVIVGAWGEFVDKLIDECVESCKQYPRYGHRELETREFYLENIKDLRPVLVRNEGCVYWQFQGERYMNGKNFDEYITKIQKE